MSKILVDENETWIYNRWRPMMGWLYMATCAFDFIIAPIFMIIIQATYHMPITQWQPLTLQVAGLYHMAMGAILGITAWTRTQEKITAFNNNGGGMPGNNPFFPPPMPNVVDATVTTDTEVPIPQKESAPISNGAANTAIANNSALPPPKLRH